MSYFVSLSRPEGADRAVASSSIVIVLPVDDRPIAHDFYRDGLGLSPVGEPADDGVPEPLQFELTASCRLMLVPRDGFGWILVGDQEKVAHPGQSECLINLPVDSEAEVDQLVNRAESAGARVTARATRQPWGYVATFADPDGHLWSVIHDGAWR